jgi:hypothetical protein
MGYELNRLMTQMGVAAPTVGALPADATDTSRAAHQQYRTNYLSRVANTPQYLQSQFNTAGATVPPVMTFSAAQRYATRPGEGGIEQVNRSIRNYFSAYPAVTQADVDWASRQWGWSEPDIRNAMGAGFEYGQGISGPAGTSQAARYMAQPGRGGLAALQQQIRGTLAANPNATDAEIAAAQATTGISNRDIYNATGNYWGNVLRAPEVTTRPAAPPPTARTPINLAGYYNTAVGRNMSEAEMVNQLRAAGVTDAQMNAARNRLLGVPENSSWEEANRLAAERGVTAPVYTDTTTTTAATTLPTTANLGSTQGLVDFYRNAAAGGASEADIVAQLSAAGVTAAQMLEGRNALLGRPAGTPYGGEAPYRETESGYARGGGVHALARKYARGGSAQVEDDGKRDFATEVSVGSDEPQMVPERRLMPAMEEPATPAPPVVPVVERAPEASPAVRPVALPEARSTPVSPAAVDLMSMVQRYAGESDPYATELREARRRAAAETERFDTLLGEMASARRAPPDKSELYFRLAAAFGAPTKFGSFGESLGNVGREMGAYQKEQRAATREDEALRRQMGLEAAKMRVGAAREDVSTLRALTAEQLKDRRALLTEYIKSGRPQSEAGKAAADMGLQPNTPEYNKFVSDYVERKLSSGELFNELRLTIAQGNLGVAREGLALRQEEQARKTAQDAKLSPTETKLVLEAEQSVGALQDSMTALDRAFKLNPQTFEGTYQDIIKRMVLEEFNPKDPRVLATREQTNLLGRGAIEKLKASFGGNPTEGERAALMQLEGIDSKSREERASIMKNTYELLKKREQRERDRLQRIRAGQFRTTTPIAGEGAE